MKIRPHSVAKNSMESEKGMLALCELNENTTNKIPFVKFLIHQLQIDLVIPYSNSRKDLLSSPIWVKLFNYVNCGIKSILIYIQETDGVRIQFCTWTNTISLQIPTLLFTPSFGMKRWNIPEDFWFPLLSFHSRQKVLHFFTFKYILNR